MPDMRKFKKFQLHYIGEYPRPTPTADDLKKARILNLYQSELDVAKRRLLKANSDLLGKTFASLKTALAHNEEIIESVLRQLSVIKGTYENEVEKIERKLYETAEDTVIEPDSFHALRAYSPLHQVKPNTKYPAVLLIVGTNDDTVNPAHSYKLAAALQAAQTGESPILLKLNAHSGHGHGIWTAQMIDVTVAKLIFLSQALGFELKSSFE